MAPHTATVGGPARAQDLLMSRLRSILLFLLLSLGVLVSSSPGIAAFRPPVTVDLEESAAALRVNGRLVARLRTENAGLLAPERAVLAAERLRAAIARGLAPGAVGVRKLGGASAVVMGKQVLILAT